jgi:multisubunit Na+/H+ antiporter MnhF subunit
LLWEYFLIITSTCYFVLTFCRCIQGPQISIRIIASEFVSSRSSLDILLFSWQDDFKS